MIVAKPFEIIVEKPATGIEAQISVLISCYKYGKEATEALDSLLEQSEPSINIVLVDDHSPDDSVAILTEWFTHHGAHQKLSSIKFIRHVENHGLSQTRNTALSLIETPYTFILDADNQVYPRALTILREALENSGYPMAYSLVEKFGIEKGIIDNSLWIPQKFSYGNYIEAMTLVRTEVLKELGGYRQMPNKFGWEDYDLWCSFVDRGLKGCHVPQILCRYRVHKDSMIRNVTNAFVESEMEKVRHDFEAHHNMPFYFLSGPRRRHQILRRALSPSGAEERVRVARALCSRLPLPKRTRHSLLVWILSHLRALERRRIQCIGL